MGFDRADLEVATIELTGRRSMNRSRLASLTFFSLTCLEMDACLRGQQLSRVVVTTGIFDCGPGWGSHNKEDETPTRMILAIARRDKRADRPGANGLLTDDDLPSSK
jgi:hypothetical protein